MKALIERMLYIAMVTVFVLGFLLVLLLMLRVIDWIIAGNWLVGLGVAAALFVLLFLIDSLSGIEARSE